MTKDTSYSQFCTVHGAADLILLKHTIYVLTGRCEDCIVFLQVWTFDNNKAGIVYWCVVWQMSFLPWLPNLVLIWYAPLWILRVVNYTYTY